MKKILSLLVLSFFAFSTLTMAENGEEKFLKGGKYITHTEDCKLFFHDNHMVGAPGKIAGTSNCTCENNYEMNKEGNACLSIFDKIKVVEDFNYSMDSEVVMADLKVDKLVKLINGSERCSQDLIMTQNLNAPAYGQAYIRNGKYNKYTGGTVREAHILQRHLNRLGFNAGKIDGIIGPKTRSAILKLQKRLGTKQDGYVGPKTRDLLNNSCLDIKIEDVILKIESKDDNSWEEKYEKEDLELSRKAYTDNYAYSNYIAGNFNLEARIKSNNPESNEYINANISLDTDVKMNIPELEIDMSIDTEYDVKTNSNDLLGEIKDIAKVLNISYKDILHSRIKIDTIVKDMDIYVKADLPSQFWKGIISGTGDISEFTDRKINVSDFEKFENKWIKIEVEENIKAFAKFLYSDAIKELKKESLNQAKIYRERPFIILDRSSKKRYGKYNSYSASFDLDNLFYLIQKTELDKNGIKISVSDKEELKDILSKNEDILKDIEFKVYLDTKTDEMRKFSLSTDIDLDGLEEDIELKIFIDLTSETTHISNTDKNKIEIPRGSEKWENIFEDIFGKSWDSIQDIQANKAKDTATKSTMSMIPIVLAINNLNSFKGGCSIISQDYRFSSLVDFKCEDNEDKFAVQVKLTNGNYFCVDIAGGIETKKDLEGMFCRK